MNDDVFVDTNVLVYAHDADAGPRHAVARALIEGMWEDRSGTLSTQVLQEFYVTVTRKVARPMPRGEARQLVAAYGEWPVHRPNSADVVAASELEERHRLSFWDALIVVSASRLGVGRLLTEDLQAGQRIGDLEIVNPFA